MRRVQLWTEESDTIVLIHVSFLAQNKREECILKRRNVPQIESTDSEDSEKPVTQSLETIVQNAASDQPEVQLSAVQAARSVHTGNCSVRLYMYVR